jgi:PIN domain nuclease of toxin-antitoxin system
MLNLDTHVLLHAVAGTLRPSERKLLTADRWSVSAIVLWETAKLAQLGRVHVWPITREIAHASTRLDVRGDPADELIAATSLVHNVPLVTRDAVLLRSKRIPLTR